MKRRRFKRSIRVIPREKWGARPPKSRSTITLPSLELWIHHSASHFPFQPTWAQKMFRRKAMEFVRDIQRYHMDTKGWSDIGYSWIAFPAFFGRLYIFEGRGTGVLGAHTLGHNEIAHGICIVGNFDTEKFGRATRRGLREFIDRLVTKGIVRGPRAFQPTGGHQDASGAATACPGFHVEERIPELRRPIDWN